MSVALLNLSLQNEPLREQIDAACKRVFDSQQFILGPDVRELELELSEYVEVPFSLGVSSGTDALIIAMMALDIGPGDEVITTPYSFFATAGSIVRLGATPVFVDIDPLTFNIDPLKIESAITQKTKAILPVHLFGQASDMQKINEIAQKYSLPVIEDAAQAIGSSFSGKKVGGLGSIACFSFFPSKNLGCFGDAGAVSTTSEDLYKKMLSIRNHGQFLNTRYLHETVGGNFRIDTLQAAILRVKLPHLDSWLKKRRANANRYQELFEQKLPAHAFEEGNISLPRETQPSFHTYNQYVLRLPFRDLFIEEAKKASIGVMIYYPYPLHLQPCFTSLGYKEGDFPESERACRESVALPIYPELPADHLESVVELLIETGKKARKW